MDFQSTALPTELQRHCFAIIKYFCFFVNRKNENICNFFSLKKNCLFESIQIRHEKASG